MPSVTSSVASARSLITNLHSAFLFLMKGLNDSEISVRQWDWWVREIMKVNCKNLKRVFLEKHLHGIIKNLEAKWVLRFVSHLI